MMKDLGTLTSEMIKAIINGRAFNPQRIISQDGHTFKITIEQVD